MNKASKLLVAVAAASGIAAYIVNKVAKSHELSFDDKMDLYRSDMESMSLEEVGDLMYKLKNNQVDATMLSDDEQREYVSAMAQFSKNVQEVASRFRESGDLDGEDADAIEDVFHGIDAYIASCYEWMN